MQLKEKLARHAAFWRREPADRPLIGYCSPGSRTAPGFDLLGEHAIQPEMVGEALHKAYRDDHTLLSVRPDRPGDLFFTPLPDLGLAWCEWLAGCSLRYSPGTRMAWAEKIAETVPECRRRWRLPLDPASDAHLERLRFALRRRQEDFPDDPVPPVLARGPFDVLCAAVGAQTVVMDLIEGNAELTASLHETALMVGVLIREQLDVIRPFHSGYANRRGLWAPGRVCMTQEDGAGLLNPRLFGEIVVEAQREIWAGFEYTMIHTHSAALGIMIDGLLESPGLRCIECTVDPGGPSLEQLLPQWKRIQGAGKSLLICGELAAGDLDTVMKILDPAGLAFGIETA